MDPALQSEILIVVLDKLEGVSTEKFAGLFHQIHGYQLKLSNYGYTSLSSLLNDMKDLVELKNTPKGSMITCISPSEHKILFVKGNDTAQPNNHVASVSWKNEFLVHAAAPGGFDDKSKMGLDTFEGVISTNKKSTPQKGVTQQPSVKRKAQQVNVVDVRPSVNDNKFLTFYDTSKTGQWTTDKASPKDANGLTVQCKFQQKSDQYNLPSSKIAEMILFFLEGCVSGMTSKTLKKRFQKELNISLKKYSKYLGHKDLNHMIKKIPSVKVMNSNQHLIYILEKYVHPTASKTQVQNTNSASKPQMPISTFNSAIQIKESQYFPDDKSAMSSKIITVPSSHILSESKVIVDTKKTEAQTPAVEKSVTSNKATKTPSKPIPQHSNMTISSKTKKTPKIAELGAVSGGQKKEAQLSTVNKVVKSKSPVICKPLTSAKNMKTQSKPILVDSKVTTSSKTVEALNKAVQHVQTVPSNNSQLIQQNVQIMQNNQANLQINNRGLLPQATYAQICKNALVVQTHHRVFPPQSIDRSQTKPRTAIKECPPDLPNMIKENIKCILELHTNGITIFNLQKFYLFRFKQHPLLTGFSSLKHFLMTLKDVASIQGFGVQALVFPVSSNEIASSSRSNNHDFTTLSNHSTSKEGILHEQSSFLRTQNEETQRFNITFGGPPVPSLLLRQHQNGNGLLPTPFNDFGWHTSANQMCKSPNNPSFKLASKARISRITKNNGNSISDSNSTGIMQNPDEKEWPSLSTNHLPLRRLIQSNTLHLKTAQQSVQSLQNVDDALISKGEEANRPLPNSHQKTTHSQTRDTEESMVSHSSNNLLLNSQTTTNGRTESPSPLLEQMLSNMSVTEEAAQQAESEIDKTQEQMSQMVSGIAESLLSQSHKKIHITNSNQGNTKSPTTKAVVQAEQKEEHLASKECMSFSINTSRQNGVHTSEVHDELHQPFGAVSQSNSVAQEAKTWQTHKDQCCIL